MIATLLPWLHEVAAAVVVGIATFVWRRFARSIRDSLREVIHEELEPFRLEQRKLEGRVQILEARRRHVTG